MQANYANALCHLNATPLNKAKMGQCLGGGLLSLSLVARTFWHTKFFKRFIFGLLRPFCHFEPLQKGDPTGCKAQAAAKKSTKITRKLTIFGYFANAQYDKFGLLLKNNGYFHSNFKTQIQIFYSKFKAFHKFNSFCKFKAFYKFKAFCKFNSFHNFISKFKPYTRLFHIFTPNFRAVFTDKFSRKEELWQQLAQKAGQEQSRRLKATGNAAKPTK